MIERLIDVALGRTPADVVLKNGTFVNVFTGQVQRGDIAIAFTTANRLPHYSGKNILETRMFYDENIDRVFVAGVEAVEEAIISSLYHAETTTGVRGNCYLGLRDFVARYGG